MKPRIDADEPVVVDFPDGRNASDRDAPVTAEGRPYYGIDNPVMVAVFAVLAVAFAAFGVISTIGSGFGGAIGPLVAAALCGGVVALMVRSSRVVKRSLWQSKLDALELRGKERALDMGCGRCLVAVELAERLPRGSVVGVDLWRGLGPLGGTKEDAERNLQLEGVADRVELVDASMEELPFDDADFDVVTASLSLHRLALAQERGNAMKEMMRVTKPGGRIVILDVGKTFEYQVWLTDAGWDDIKRSRGSYSHYPPVRSVSARKPKK